MSLQSRKHSPVCDKEELRQKEKEEEHPGSLKANHNGLPKSIPTLSGTLSFPSFLRPAKCCENLLNHIYALDECVSLDEIENLVGLMVSWMAMDNLMLDDAETQCSDKIKIGPKSNCKGNPTKEKLKISGQAIWKIFGCIDSREEELMQQT
ncbi:hypothetical protein JHK82_055233 [Glycine max]|nr:hypothetical protein JHK82_055233 [Glycine max]